MRWERLFSDLLVQLDHLPPDPGREEFLGAVQVWLRGAVMKWSHELRARWALDEYASMDLSQFPTHDASLIPVEELQQLRAVPPGSMETFAMRLRDIFWGGITVESSVRCPRCGDSQLKILEEPGSGDIVLACDLCGWAQTSDGARWCGARNLRPVTRHRVEEWWAEDPGRRGA